MVVPVGMAQERRRLRRAVPRRPVAARRQRPVQPEPVRVDVHRRVQRLRQHLPHLLVPERPRVEVEPRAGRVPLHRAQQLLHARQLRRERAVRGRRPGGHERGVEVHAIQPAQRGCLAAAVGGGSREVGQQRRRAGQAVEPPGLAADVAGVQDGGGAAGALEQEHGGAEAVVGVEQGEAQAAAGRELEQRGAVEGHRAQDGAQVAEVAGAGLQDAGGDVQAGRAPLQAQQQRARRRRAVDEGRAPGLQPRRVVAVHVAQEAGERGRAERGPVEAVDADVGELRDDAVEGGHGGGGGGARGMLSGSSRRFGGVRRSLVVDSVVKNVTGRKGGKSAVV
nr:hypothetical protein CFP56_08135 [Quercus suber]